MSKNRGRGRRSCGGGRGGRGRAVSPSPSPEPTRQQQEQTAREERAAQRAVDQRQREIAARTVADALVGAEKRRALEGAANNRRMDGFEADHAFLEGRFDRFRGQVRRSSAFVFGVLGSLVFGFFFLSMGMLFILDVLRRNGFL